MSKEILIRMKLVGRGIVNYDNSDQKYMWNYIKHGTRVNPNNNNVMFAKGAYNKVGETDEGKPILEKLIKISTDCLRNGIFPELTSSAIANITHSPQTLMKYISNPAAVLKGYMFPELNVKRSSPVCMSDAIQTCSAVSMMEQFSVNAPKTTKDSTDETSDPTFYQKENVGHIEYESFAVLNLAEMGFIPISDVTGRMNVTVDNVDVYRKLLGKYFEVPAPAYYHKSTKDQFPEFGIQLGEDAIKYLVKESLTKLAFININRRSAFARVVKLEIKVVNDSLTDLFSTEHGWVTVKDEDNNVPFNLSAIDDVVIDFPYVEINEADAIQNLIEMKEAMKESKAKKNKEKKEKKDKASVKPPKPVKS